MSTHYLNQVEIAEIKWEFMAYDGTYLVMSWRALWHWSKFLERSKEKRGMADNKSD